MVSCEKAKDSEKVGGYVMNIVAAIAKKGDTSVHIHTIQM